MPPGLDTLATGFHADQAHTVEWNVIVENAHRIGAATDACEHRIRLTANHFRHLREAFLADDRIKIAHHHRVRMRSRHRTDNVKGALDIRHPVAHGFVQCIFQRFRSAVDGYHGRAQQLHAIDVLRLALYIFATHVDHAFKTVARRDGCGGNTMLAGAGFRDHAALVHATRQQSLPNGIVNFVGTGVIQIFPFQENLRTAQLIR